MDGGSKRALNVTKRSKGNKGRLSSTLRDELIYCQIYWWIVNNLSQAAEFTHSVLAALSERTLGEEQAQLSNIKE